MSCLFSTLLGAAGSNEVKVEPVISAAPYDPF